MAQVFLGLGSNTNARQNITNALNALHKQFGDIILSPVYESESLGFVGDNFLNLVVALNTELQVGKLLEHLKNIEDQNGRDRSAPKFSGRTLDIDILTYDKKSGIVDGVSLPRDEIFKNAFVLKPFSELAPNFTPPTSTKNLTELWESFDAQSQKLWPISFDWSAN